MIGFLREMEKVNINQNFPPEIDPKWKLTIK